MEFVIFFVLFLVLRGPLTASHRGTNTVCFQYFPLMTSSNGAPVDNKITSISAGPAGPLLTEDFVLFDNLASFVRERIPERVIHAKGAGAFGEFEVTSSVFTKYCKASLFQTNGKKTNIAVRFSSTIGESGSAETTRDIRGFAIKFYTDDGNWDLVGAHLPVCYVRDPLLFPSLIHALKRHPRSHLPDPDVYWDFVSGVPESTLTVMFLHTDRGIPQDYRHMNGYSVNTYKVVNTEGTPFYCKFTLRSLQGIKNMDPEAAEKLAGSDPDFATRDLFEAIEKENFPVWILCFQVMTFSEAASLDFNPFDTTKIWPQKDFPLFSIGKLKLNKNPKNYFADIEQAAYSPSNLVPGIEPSADKILQARLVAYSDAQRYRLGVNYQQLPINCPFQVTVINNHRDGKMCFNNQGNAPNYFPNSYNGQQICPAVAPTRWTVTGDVARHLDLGDPFTQCTTFWSESINEAVRSYLVKNISASLKKASKNIQERVLANFKRVHVDFAKQVAAAIG